MKLEYRDLAWSLPREAGPEVEARMLEVFRRRKRQQRTRWLLGAAAAIAIGSGTYWMSRSPGESHGKAEASFVALPYSESGVPLENPVIVQVNIGRSEMGALGVSAAMLDRQRISGSAKVKADLLIGQDGVARAVRFVE